MTDAYLMKSTRKKLGMNQSEMADKLGYGAQSRISEIESGRKEMSQQVRNHLDTIERYELNEDGNG